MFVWGNCVCVCVHACAPSTWNFWRTLPILKEFRIKFIKLKDTSSILFQFPTIRINNMEDARISKAKLTLAPLTVDSDLVCRKRSCSIRHCLFVNILWVECNMAGVRTFSSAFTLRRWSVSWQRQACGVVYDVDRKRSDTTVTNMATMRISNEFKAHKIRTIFFTRIKWE
jgi:hypothetical protein